MKEIKLLSTDKKNELNVYIWECEGKPEAILQLSHGMKEHLLRYDEFAKYISSKNILVIGNDHLGHGKSARRKIMDISETEKVKRLLTTFIK